MSDGCQAVLRKSSSSQANVNELSESCLAFVRQSVVNFELSDDFQAVLRKSGSKYLVRQLSRRPQEFYRQLFGSHQVCCQAVIV